MSSLLRLERKQKNYSNSFLIRIFLFFLSHLELKWYAPVVSSTTIPDFRPKWAKCIPVFRPNSTKTRPDGAAHTYIAYVREYPLGTQHEINNWCHRMLQSCPLGDFWRETVILFEFMWPQRRGKNSSYITVSNIWIPLLTKMQSIYWNINRQAPRNLMGIITGLN